jgi:hypothetical protein
VVKPTGVYVWNQNSAPVAGAGAQQERVMGMIQLEGNGVQIFLRASELDEDVRQYLEFRRKREVDKLREMMKEEGFKPVPATQPSTSPTQPVAAPVEKKQDL